MSHLRVMRAAAASLIAAVAFGACSTHSNEPVSPPAIVADGSMGETPSDAATERAATDTATDAADISSAVPCPVGEIKAPPSSLGLSSFYTRYLDANGIPIVSSDAPDQAALARAAAS